MTTREFTSRVMELIRELGREMSNEDYSNSLDRLSVEIEEECYHLNLSLDLED